jgi:acyl-CoA thioester hydrolase
VSWRGLVTTVPIRWVDTDPLGHVSNSVVLAYLDEVRDAYLSAKLAGFDRSDYVVARIEVDFVRPIGLRHGVVLGRAEAVECGVSRIVLDERLEIRTHEPAVTARTTVVYWDPKGQRTRPLSRSQRSALLESGSSLSRCSKHGADAAPRNSA